MYRFCSWFLDQYDVGLFQIIIVPRNPPKKTLAQLWMSICEQKKSLFWLGLKGFCPPKAFVELPTLAAQPQRLRSQGIWLLFSFAASVVSCKVETINKAAKLSLSSWELLTSCKSTRMRSGKQKLYTSPKFHTGDYQITYLNSSVFVKSYQSPQILPTIRCHRNPCCTSTLHHLWVDLPLSAPRSHQELLL